ncbi:DNA gyrase inhibitor YacG [Gilvimarinus agarilyticus]|uniref:DNA gyrase inhibitor YacG n=1 Tax=Gilvimarinus sp. 2_MG-2023 TaxID=3062666 RepID=UPI001C0A3436|nr:DNA gyrase inhibitor YacG [Gilvimarinus sp. 2_MG-2023]MBU2885413.1 DNA gyrase inhibitor YacG [Gilvimarinus agarilyticus]MDO6570312.1 DNA gyrase inhibitor YacG [Gilvimarinus sp. 2_MG-2023]
MNDNTPPIKLACPTCQKKIFWSDEFPHRPFCSERCKLIDLGEWANENHRIAGEDASAQNDEFDD